MGKAAKSLTIILTGLVFAGSVGAVDLVEAVGAQRCGRRVKSFVVEFLAPDSESLEASAKALVRELEADRQLRLSLDGRPCAFARCSFRANKGQTYRFVAESDRVAFDELCVVISRP